MAAPDAPEESEGDQIPDGAAVFPEIPAELGVHPLLLAVVHATVFLVGSDEDIVHPDAAEETVGRMADYLRRLEGESLRRVQEDMACLVGFARQQRWPKGMVQSLRTFLADFGIESEKEA